MARERSVSDVCEVLALGWSFDSDQMTLTCISTGGSTTLEQEAVVTVWILMVETLTATL